MTTSPSSAPRGGLTLPVNAEASTARCSSHRWTSTTYLLLTFHELALDGSLTATRNFSYEGDAIVEESTNGVTSRGYVVDETGAVVKFCDPNCATPTANYLVTWNGHGDALAAWRINGDGTLTLANSYIYSSWGAPTTATHNGVGDLGFRFLYVGRYDVQWDNFSGLGLHYMHARHYSPNIGRFLQPDPAALETNHYAYAANNPVTGIDPDGRLVFLAALVFLAPALAALGKAMVVTAVIVGAGATLAYGAHKFVEYQRQLEARRAAAIRQLAPGYRDCPSCAYLKPKVSKEPYPRVVPLHRDPTWKPVKQAAPGQDNWRLEGLCRRNWRLAACIVFGVFVTKVMIDQDNEAIRPRPRGALR